MKKVLGLAIFLAVAQVTQAANIEAEKILQLPCARHAMARTG